MMIYNEKLVDQTKIIDPQNQVFAWKTGGTTFCCEDNSCLRNEVVFFRSLKSCNTTLAPKKIQAAVMKVADTNERSKNGIVHGIEENDGEQLRKKSRRFWWRLMRNFLLNNFSEWERKRMVQWGQCSLKSTHYVQRILNNARKLRTKDGLCSIHISPDRTLDEQKAYKKLIEETKFRRSKEPDKVHVIKKNKIVSFSRQGEPGESGMIWDFVHFTTHICDI